MALVTIPAFTVTRLPSLTGQICNEGVFNVGARFRLSPAGLSPNYGSKGSLLSELADFPTGFRPG